MQLEFFVSKNEQSLGPWTIEQVADQLGQGAIVMTDFVFDDERQDWIPLLECTALSAHLTKGKPKAPPPPRKAATSHVSAAMPPSATATEMAITPPGLITEVSDEWFVQRASHRYGPFTYFGLLKALQEKSVFPLETAWKNGMEQWVPIAQLAEFNEAAVRSVLNTTKGTGAQEIFVQRRHPRVKFEGEVMAHDNRSLWIGRSLEGSLGGSGLLIQNAGLVPGQVLLLHFTPQDLAPFNALCEVVSKKFNGAIRDQKAPVGYNVRFLKMDSKMAPAVQDYFTSAAAQQRAQG